MEKKIFRTKSYIRIYDTRKLCSLESQYRDTINESILFVRVNEKPVIDVCEEIAKGTKGSVSVQYTF